MAGETLTSLENAWLAMVAHPAMNGGIALVDVLPCSGGARGQVGLAQFAVAPSEGGSGGRGRLLRAGWEPHGSPAPGVFATDLLWTIVGRARSPQCFVGRLPVPRCGCYPSLASWEAWRRHRPGRPRGQKLPCSLHLGLYRSPDGEDLVITQ